MLAFAFPAAADKYHGNVPEPRLWLAAQGKRQAVQEGATVGRQSGSQARMIMPS
jgi:hypothetical protein